MKKLLILFSFLFFLLFLSEKTEANNSEIIIYHVTDPHGTLPQEMIDFFINQKGDLIVVTGDVAYEPKSDKIYREIKSQLDSTGIPYIVVQGNHDSNDTAWKNVWGKFNDYKLLGDFLVIGISWGKFNKTWAEEVIKQNPNKMIIWASHFPYEECYYPVLRDEFFLNYDFALVLIGHYHHYVKTWNLGKNGKLIREYMIDGLFDKFEDEGVNVNIIKIKNGIINHTYYDVSSKKVYGSEIIPITKSLVKSYDFSGHVLEEIKSLPSTNIFDKDYGRFEIVDINGKKLLLLSKDGIWIYNSRIQYEGKLREDACIAASYGDINLKNQGNELAITNGTHVFVYNSSLNLIQTIDLSNFTGFNPLPIRDILIADVFQNSPGNELVIGLRAPDEKGGPQVLVYNSSWQLVKNISLTSHWISSEFPHLAYGKVNGLGDENYLFVIYYITLYVFNKTLDEIKTQYSVDPYYTSQAMVTDYNNDGKNELWVLGHAYTGEKFYHSLQAWINLSYTDYTEWHPWYGSYLEENFHGFYSFNFAVGNVSTPIIVTDDLHWGSNGYIFDTFQHAHTKIPQGAYAICDLDNDGKNELYLASGNGILKVYDVINKYFNSSVIAKNIELLWENYPHVYDTEATLKNVEFFPSQKYLELELYGKGTKQIWINSTIYGKPESVKINEAPVAYSYNHITKLISFNISFSSLEKVRIIWKAVRILGILRDKNNNPLQAKIIAFQEGTNVIVSLTQTDSNGNYSLLLPQGIYDIQFNLTEFNIPIKLLSVNLTEDLVNLIKYVSYEDSKVSIALDNNYSKRIEVYSMKKPLRVKLNGTIIPSWSYDLDKRIISINLSAVMAKSGYWKDIQEAVDLVASMGGGNVYIPEGTFNFVNVNESWTGARVVIPAGVNLFGARTERYENGSVKEWKTVLVMPWDMPGDKSYNPPHWFLIEGNSDPNKSSRFSDIKLVGYREFNHSATGMYRGILIKGVQNFRIDHCFFDEIPEGVETGIQTTYPSSGIIDHNIFDNEYCNYTLDWYTREVGYGIGVNRHEWWTTWDNITDILGQYLNYTVFIEDNFFTRWRSVVAGNRGAHYVFRHNIVKGGLGKGEVDIHPSWNSPYVSCRAAEVYENIFIDPVNIHAYAVEMFAGGGVFFNNTLSGYEIFIIDSATSWNTTLMGPQEVYIWNNNLGGAIVEDGWMEENVHYFLYKPDWYTPYPYPHPLTLE